MGYLFHFAAAILMLALAEGGLAQALPDSPGSAGRAVWIVVLLALVPHALGLCARRAFARGRFRRAGSLLNLIHVTPVLLFGIAVGFLGWVELVEGASGRSARLVEWPHPVLLAALSPFLVYSLLAIDARSRAGGGPPATQRGDRIFHTRMFLGAGLPIAAFVLLAWLVGLSDTVRVHIEEVSVWSAVFSAFLITTAVWSLPRMLALMWDTVPLGPSPARDLLERTARLARFRCRDVFVWRTGNLVANAAIVGLTPRQRIVLFSDALLGSLDPRELIAVYAHEIGHAQRHHVAIFGMWALGFLMAADLGLSRIGAEDELFALLLTLPVIAMWFFGFGFLSRRFELEADLYSLELTRDGDALSSALLRVGGGLHAAKRSSWRHFSTERRIDFIERAAGDPAVGRRLRKSLRLLAWAGGLTFLVASGFQLARMAGTWQLDQLTSDLRLGRYAQAEARLEHVSEPSAQLERIVSCAGELERSGRSSTEAIESAAFEALAAREAQQARDYVELLLLRGEPLDEVAEFLESPEGRALPATTPRWRARLESWLAARSVP